MLIEFDKINNCAVKHNSGKLKTCNKVAFTSAASINLLSGLKTDTVSFQKKPVKPYTDKMNEIGDFKQLNTLFPDNGDYYCGPVSLSNCLIWLSKNGYPKLYTDKNQVELVKKLAKKFNTNPEVGTTVQNMCDGLNEYINQCGYKPAKLLYSGIRPISGFHSGNLRPNLDEIKKAIEKKGLVLLGIGCYKHEKINGKDIYNRIDGHWVALSGHSFDGKNPDPDYLVIHDPYTPSNGSIKNDFIKLNKLDKGKLVGKKEDIEGGFPLDADGFYQITGGTDQYFDNSDTNLLEGALILQM